MGAANPDPNFEGKVFEYPEAEDGTPLFAAPEFFESELV
jgi:hypothetical protein